LKNLWSALHSIQVVGNGKDLYAGFTSADNIKIQKQLNSLKRAHVYIKIILYKCINKFLSFMSVYVNVYNLFSV